MSQKQLGIPTENTSEEKIVRFTADLPESLHRKLSLEAARQGKRKVDIVRELLKEKLKNVKE